jgi:hypothetical protein
MKRIALNVINRAATAYGKTFGLIVKLKAGSSTEYVSQKTIKPRRKSEPTNVSSLFPP